MCILPCLAVSNIRASSQEGDYCCTLLLYSCCLVQSFFFCTALSIYIRSIYRSIYIYTNHQKDEGQYDLPHQGRVRDSAV